MCSKLVLGPPLTQQEWAIINEFMSELSAMTILKELVQYRCVSEVLENRHLSPFQDVPSKLMKKIDRLYLESISSSSPDLSPISHGA